MYQVTNRIAGKARESAMQMPIYDKFSDTVAGQLHVASEADIDEALNLARSARTEAPLTSHERADILREAARLLAGRADELAEVQRVEAGFTLADGRKEVERAIETMLLSADEAIRFGGESIPLGSAPNTRPHGDHHSQADRCRRRDHSIQLAGEHHRAQGGRGDRGAAMRWCSSRPR